MRRRVLLGNQPKIIYHSKFRLNANSVMGKLNAIKCLAETYTPDIVAICETKVGSNIEENELLGDR